VTDILSDLIPVVALIALGLFLGRSGFMGDEFASGLKRLVASVTLPALLFTAFARLELAAEFFLLAAVIFLSCGVLGLAGRGVAAAARLPRPSTTLLFQGFEAGMLGYALFVSFYGAQEVPAFATADLGQVLYVFTVLMAQLLSGESSRALRPADLARRLVSSPVILAIAAGLLSSALVPRAAGLPWAADGFLAPTFAAIGSLTTPLVCLVVGYGLKGAFGRPAAATHGAPVGARGGAVLAVVLIRLAAAGALGALVAFVVVPALGFPRIQSAAVLSLFLLPPPFVIPVFRTRSDDAAFVSSVLSLHTLFSLAAVFAAALLFGGAA
jgi:predicted permease